MSTRTVLTRTVSTRTEIATRTEKLVPNPNAKFVYNAKILPGALFTYMIGSNTRVAGRFINVALPFR